MVETEALKRPLDLPVSMAFPAVPLFLAQMVLLAALLAPWQTAPLAHAAEARVGTVFPLVEIPLVTRASGVVEQLPVQEGQRVRRGQRILSLDRRRQLGEIKLLEMQIAHRAALRLEELNLATARQDLARDEALLHDNSIPPKAVEDSRNRVRLAAERVSIERGKLEEQRQLLALKKQELADYEVLAPGDGVLSSIALHPNQFVSSGTRAGEFLQLDQVLVETFVPLAEARKLASGARATIRTDEGKIMVGRVKTIGQRVDPVSSSVKVKILVPNPRIHLKPGMLVKVSL